MNLTTARELVIAYLEGRVARKNSSGSTSSGDQNRPRRQLVIAQEREYEFGWVFFWNTKEFAETGDHRHALAGNAPLIVDHNDGQLYVTGTAHSLDYYLADYRKGIRHPAS